MHIYASILEFHEIKSVLECIREDLFFWSAKTFSIWLEVIIFLRCCLKGLELLGQAGGQRLFFGQGPLR